MQHEAELDTFYQLFNAASIIDWHWVGSYSDFRAQSPKQAQLLLKSHGAMLIEGMPFQTRHFDWEALRSIFGDASDVMFIGKCSNFDKH